MPSGTALATTGPRSKTKDETEFLKGFVEPDQDLDEFSDASYQMGSENDTGSDSDSDSGSDTGSQFSSDSGSDTGSGSESESEPDAPVKRVRTGSPGKSSAGFSGSSVADINRLTAELGGDPGDGRTGHERRASTELDELMESVAAGKAKANSKRKRQTKEKGTSGKNSMVSKTTKKKSKSKSKSKSSRISRDDHPDVLRGNMRKDELELLDSIMADVTSGSQEGGASPPPRRSRRARHPPRRYIDRRDVRKHVQGFYTDGTKPDKMEAYIKMLENDIVADPLTKRFVDETAGFSSEEGYDTEEERTGISKKKQPWSKKKKKKIEKKKKKTPQSPKNTSGSESGSGSGSESGSETDFSGDGSDASSVDSRAGSRAGSPSRNQFRNLPTSHGI